ncbi:MAG: LamG domain-containing protein [Planctomycetota bacterium]
MMEVRKSGFLWAITLLIAIFSLSFPAYAKYSGGAGEPNDPYQIATAEDLMLLGENSEDYDKHFILTADIDLDPNLPGRKVFDKAVIAKTVMVRTRTGGREDGILFTGFFNGSGYKISHLTIRGGRNLGLFGRLGNGAEIKNLGVTDCNIVGFDYIGGLVGENSGTVTNCYSTGTIDGNEDVGGLVGSNRGYISQCYNTCTVSGYIAIGGLAGFNLSRIANCYNSGAVSGIIESIGGLVGINFASIDNCHSIGTVNDNWMAGGLVGYYSLGTLGTVANCFWDVETSGQTTSGGGMGKTTAEMQMESTFTKAGWDFVAETENGTEDIWWIDEGQDYPRLWWEPSLERTIDLVVDDFESYNDLDHDDPNSNRIYLVWIDGWDDPSNGAIIGFVEPPFVGRTIAHSGVQSMSFAYHNGVGYSEATANVANLTIGRDWTTEGVSVLSLWFGDLWGAPSNAPEPMYVALANADGSTAVVYHDNLNATQVDTWTEWRINLKRFANQGVDITNIETISIGFGDKNNPHAGGSGVMYFDDIKVTSTSSSLVSHWQFDEGTGSAAFDSWGSNDGTITGASWVNGLIGDALDFDGSGDYVNVGNDDSLEIDITNSNVTISAWIYPKVLDNYEPVFVADDYDGAYYGYMLMITPNGKVWLTYGDGTGVDLNSRKTKTGTTSLQTDTWYHVVGVIRGGTDMSIFINGLDDGGEYSGNGGEVSYSSASASIGRVRFGTLDNEFNGSLDDVMVFNRALTEGEVRLLPVLLKRGIPLP